MSGDPDSIESLSKPRRIDVPGDEQASFGEGFDDKRLWIGNLDPKLTEFALLKVAEKYGKIRKLDFIYHRGGPDKGLSKGYCFVSFHTWEAAETARTSLDGKQIKGRPMYVKWAHGSKFEEMELPIKKNEGIATSESADTKLAAASLPSASSQVSASPHSKIQAIEAKLKMMEAGQKDFGIHQTIQANPAYNPMVLAQQQRQDSSSNRRSAPYNRRGGQSNRSRSRR